MKETQQATLLASQPIYNQSGELFAVELLYRSDTGLSALDVGDEFATSELLFNLCTGITKQTEHYQKPVFINVSAEFLLSQRFLPISSDRVVIELVERIQPTPELVDSVRKWRAEGYRFALDDFEFKESWDPLLELASFIKVDVASYSAAEIMAQREALQKHDVLWLAERIEDEATYRTFLDMGFDLFQGYFHARPIIIYGLRLPPAAMHLVKLILQLYAAEPDINEITATVSADPEMAVSLIRVVNSPLYRSSQKITTVKDVVVRLGLEKLKRWVALIGTINATSRETSRIVLARAFVCQELARRSVSGIPADRAFLAGLLSGSDALFGVDKSAFLSELHLSDDLYAAVVFGENELGKLIELACRVERAVHMKIDLENLDRRLLRLYLKSVERVQALFNIL